MDLEQSSTQQNPDTEKGAKENSSAAGNHGDAHVNGMTNGYERQKEHKSEHRSKERSHKSEHRDKDKSRDKEKSRKSEHRDKDKDKDRHKHSSSSSKDNKDRHSSSNKDKDKDKEKKSSSSSSSKDHNKSSSSSSKDRDKSKDHHKSSSSKDKEKEKHHSSSSSSKDKDSSKSKDKDKDKHRHSSSHDKDKSSKDKDRKHSSDKDRHSSSHGDKNKSSEKDKHRHRHEKDKSKHKDERKQEVKEEPKIKEELEKTESFNNQQQQQDIYNQVKNEQESMNNAEDDGNSSDENGLYIKEDDDEDIKQENNSQNSSDGNDTRLSDLHNTTIKSEESDEDVPLAARTASPHVKRQLDSSDEDVPLSARKKIKQETNKMKKKKKKRKRSSDDEDDSGDDFEEKTKKKAVKKEKPPASTPSPRKKKKEEEEVEVWKWWEEDNNKKKNKDGEKWTFLEHKGPVFAPDYEPLPSSVQFFYGDKEIKLSKDAEEVATFYARMIDHDYTSKDTFNDNFFADWQKVMTESEKKKITNLSKCNFRPMSDYFIQKTEERKAMSKEEKKKIKEKNDEMLKEYGFCTIDGHKEKIGNFKIEPPGLFRGRGEHPKMGRLKKRVIPEDVSINCSKDSIVPKPPAGHKWKDVRHDPTVTWLASWTENVQGQVKYVMLNPSSKLKGEKDMQKYEIARKLAKTIDKIRAEYREDWKSKEMRVRQRAVALYFIDKLALRAGNEKDGDEQADTVGCCSLRVEHIKLHEKLDDEENVVEFDFLGKDSIRYHNKVSVEKRVFKNLQLFKDNKQDGDDLFDRLDTTVLNKHLNTLMEGLTAKVFRTYNASWTLQEQLNKLTNEGDSIAEKILSYNRANRAVAVLCNHQRAEPKTFQKSMENLKAKIDAKKTAVKEAEKEVKEAKRDARQGGAGKDLYEKAKKKLERLQEQALKLDLQMTDRDENKTIALGTSKLNYLDPRISVAWCKKHDVPIEKIYNKTQRDKFRWAIDMAGADYVF